MDRDTLDRRTVLETMAAGAVTTAIAGCSSGGGGSGDDGSAGDGESDGNGDGGSGGSGDSVDFDGWFDNASNYDGVVDRTGRSEVTVTVGAAGNNGNFAFDPAAVRVSTGTTVVWEWTGKGSLHNVVAESGDFESERTQEEGFTFEQTFDGAGTYKYYCTPHRTMGMKGAIVVE